MNFKYIQITVLLFIGLSFNACKHKAQSDSEKFNAVESDTLKYSLFSLDTTDAACLQKYKNCPNATVSYPIFNTPDTSLNAYLNSEVLKIVLYNTDTSSYTSPIESVESYFKENADLKKEGDYDDESSAWTNDNNVSVYHKLGQYITIKSYHQSYQGGAHPIATTNFYTFDILNKKQLKASDILNLSDTALLRIGQQYFKSDNNIEDTASLSGLGYFIFGDGDNYEESAAYGKFRFNDNFAITKNGIEFQYNPYEMAPYAAGAPSVTIPYNSIQPFLKIKIW
ncbi:MAG: RsiV family protein [Chitinophagales bacterium]|mgnify:CR=1 FL=1|nr:RsiV family protein [Chitinophagales bacterium]